MSVLKNIQDYLSANPWQKAKDLAIYLGSNRKSVNSALYANPKLFQKNEQKEWALARTQSRVTADAVLDMLPATSLPEGIVPVRDIDLVERIKKLLKVYVSLEARDIAELLDKPQQIVSRTLRAYKEIFDKTANGEWFICEDSEDNITESDSHNVDIEPQLEQVNNLQSADYKEDGKPPQQAVIEARLDRNFLVLAPPGTGKTHTVIERLVYAITQSHQEVDPGKLLVLSFTRAAVGEVRERIARAIINGAPPRLRYVRVMTFDAYTTWLLNDGSYDISGQGYDARIRLLTKELQKVSLRQATERIAKARYLFVDEIQDLVGIRADMVFELIKRILIAEGSVTLLGDPHQSLNDYQIKGNETDSSKFLEKVQHLLRDGLEQFELEDSYRYETLEMESISKKSKRVLDNAEWSAEDKFSALLALIPEVSTAVLEERFKSKSIDALLCRSNGEVFRWFNWHQEQGNDCTLNAGAVGRPWPAWIGKALMHYQSDVITSKRLISRARTFEDTRPRPSEIELKDFLLRERLVRGGIINLKELASRMTYLSPAKKGDTPDNGLIVSTVHKAKGLEYKNVVVVEPNQRNISEEEVRVLYVAITRAKRCISLLPKDQTPFSGWIKKGRGGRLRFEDNGNKYLQVIGIEDFDLDTLFITKDGAVDTLNLENYLLCYQEKRQCCIRPESCNADNDHNYVLYLNSCLGLVRICAVSSNMKKSLDAMSWGNKYGDAGAMLDISDSCDYQTIVHPMVSPILSRLIGPAGIMVFPLIQGFYPISRDSGE